MLQAAVVRHIDRLRMGGTVEGKVPVTRMHRRIIGRQQHLKIADIGVAVLHRRHAAGVGQDVQLPLNEIGETVEPVAVTALLGGSGKSHSDCKEKDLFHIFNLKLTGNDRRLQVPVRTSRRALHVHFQEIDSRTDPGTGPGNSHGL